MRTFGRISLIILLGAVCFVSGAYVNSVYTKWFYPNRYEGRFQEYAQEDRNRFTQGALTGEQNGGMSEAGQGAARTEAGGTANTDRPAEPEQMPAAADGGDCTDCDTVFVVMRYDMQTMTTTQEEDKIPAQYMGMNREGMQEAIGMYVASPPLSELNQGFVTAELVSFSPERVVVKKSYQKEEESHQFIILAEQNYVTVYRNDTETVYLYTDIRVDELPPEVQQEVIRQKYVDNEEELYNFLESYSS